MKSKAMVVTEPNHMEMQEFEVLPAPGEHALIKTTVTSVCSSDIKIFHGTTPICKYPLIMGHEISGAVVELGPEADKWFDLAPGDRVTVEPYIPCGRCEASRSEHFYHHCTHGGIYGLTRTCTTPPHLFGGYSQYMYLTPGTVVHKLNSGVDPMAASLSSVVANGVRWVKTLGKVQFGESVVISGPGSQGLSSLASALESGAYPVIVLGLSTDGERLKLAKEFGAQHVIDVDKHDAVEAVRQLLPDGADAVIETSGTPRGIQASIKMVRRAGRIVSIGLSGGVETPIRFDDLVWNSISILTGLGQAGNVQDAMKLINSGKYPFAKINNTIYKLEELEQAIKDAEERPEGFIKGAVVFE